eukprot:scaffold1734_cov196-Cylindrotheca_fusiformis.AAC.1
MNHFPHGFDILERLIEKRSCNEISDRLSGHQWKLEETLQLCIASMKTMAATKIIVGLNGALQKRFILPDEGVLVPGNVHRAKSVQTGVGGKGQD